MEKAGKQGKKEEEKEIEKKAEKEKKRKGEEKGEKESIKKGEGEKPAKKESAKEGKKSKEELSEKERKAREAMERKAKEKEELRYIVRIAGKDLDGKKPIFTSLMQIKGVSHRFARIAAMQFEKETGTAFDSSLGLIPEEQDSILESIISEPEKHSIPEWVLNRRKDFSTGKSSQLVMGDLDFAKRKDVKRLNIIKSYRGLRHSWGLPVRGQRTKSTHRGKGPVVGVLKKEARKAQQKKSEKK